VYIKLLDHQNYQTIIYQDHKVHLKIIQCKKFKVRQKFMEINIDKIGKPINKVEVVITFTE